jgi:anti-sigma regulatory factor (Ser/Thr protein kinase)
VTTRASQHFDCAHASPGEARRFCASNLSRALGADAHELIDDAQMIVSELLTNAINAQCDGADLIVSVQDGVVRIEVLDDADGVPQLRAPHARDERGRGLLIVAALASDWGYELSTKGKRVWAELQVDRAA